MTIPNFDEGTDRKLCIICSKGNLDMALPGLVLANAALGEGIETHLFFTFWGLDMVVESRMDHLQFSAVGNTAMHLPDIPLPGGRKLATKDARMPQLAAMLPGMTQLATKMMHATIEDIGVPPVREFLDQIEASGAHLWACKMAMDMGGLTKDDLYAGVEDVINAGDFIIMAEGAQLLFI